MSTTAERYYLLSNKMRIYLGKKDLDILPFEHWALKVGDTWYEIDRVGKHFEGDRMEINVHQDDAKYDEIEELGYTERGAEVVDRFNARWKREDRRYSMVFNNCQDYVKELATAYGIDMRDTQRLDVLLLGVVGIIGISTVASLLEICSILLMG